MTVGDSVSKDWPSKGRIVFDNVSFQYNISSQPAIRNVSFVVEPEEKVKRFFLSHIQFVT